MHDLTEDARDERQQALDSIALYFHDRASVAVIVKIRHYLGGISALLAAKGAGINDGLTQEAVLRAITQMQIWIETEDNQWAALRIHDLTRIAKEG